MWHMVELQLAGHHKKCVLQVAGHFQDPQHFLSDIWVDQLGLAWAACGPFCNLFLQIHREIRTGPLEVFLEGNFLH